MQNHEHSLLDALTSVSAEINRIAKRIEHLGSSTTSEDKQKCVQVINELLRTLDHAVEKLT